MADIRPNRVKRRLQEGKTATVLVGPTSADIAEWAGSMGFDGVFIDCEHGSFTWDNLANMTRACDVWGMTSISRVNDNNPWLITRTLDVGAQGVVIPHVNNKVEGEQAARSSKYNMDNNGGYRGMGGGRQSFGVADYHRKANAETMVVALIEEQQAVENLTEILTVDNIDVFMLAPGDLAQTMGYTGQMNHPEVKALGDRAIAQIVAAGRTAGTLVNEDNVEDYYSKGVRFFLNSWQGWLARGAAQYISKVPGG